MAQNPKRVMLVVGVPEPHLQAVLDAIAEAGAGIIGNYTHCSFTSPGTGRFKPNAAANPVIGENETVNLVHEIRVETWCERDRVKAVVAALRAAHPYEEPVYYLLPLLSEEDF